MAAARRAHGQVPREEEVGEPVILIVCQLGASGRIGVYPEKAGSGEFPDVRAGEESETEKHDEQQVPRWLARQ